MVDTLKEILEDFVLLAAAIDYGGRLIKLLKKFLANHKSPRKLK